LVPASVALYIVAAYWFTSSTSFANPAITIARSLSNSFAGIAPANVPAFIAAQLVGAALAAGLHPGCFRRPRRRRPAEPIAPGPSRLPGKPQRQLLPFGFDLDCPP
jgi:glycerol uptake facilitator-like aquaporin